MPNYVSLFSSAGVGCYGLNQLGYECAASAELLEKRLDIQKINNKCKYPSGYISGDLTSPETHAKLCDEINKFKEKEAVKDIDLIIATPPCQGMSVANHKKKDELSRNSLVIESIRIIAEQKPRFFIFENVSAFLKSICTDIDGIDKTIKEAIYQNLAAQYYIDGKVLNLKNFGANSSRTRTLVIGVRRDQEGVTPVDLYPDYQDEKTLKEVIGHLPRLLQMGEFDPKDIFHSFRPYKEHLYPWIAATEYGKSAFDNKSMNLKPHQMVDGELVLNKSKNGDKYKRQVWEKVAPCVHTRNDCLPSQNTIHPTDNRVFSIRELMLMMTIPKRFKWVNAKQIPSNEASYEEKNKFRKETEINIRQCIGEAVPTAIFTQIGRKIKASIAGPKKLKKSEILSLISENKLNYTENLLTFIDEYSCQICEEDLFSICELSNAERLDTAAFYTSKQICFAALEHLPEMKKDEIRILEPSVGAGIFISQISKKYPEKKLIIDCVDINKESLEISKKLCQKLVRHPRIEINFFNVDFLEWETQHRYDLVVGNPPFMKVKDNEKLLKYKKNAHNRKTNNIFSFFVERAINLGKNVSLILPKSFLSSPEYQLTRELVEDKKLIHINDFNEKAFDVKIETISITFENTKRIQGITTVYSYLLKSFITQQQDYIVHNNFSSWLLYRDRWFDEISSSLKFGVFKVFRDRAITKKTTKSAGKYRVIKSRNIGNGKILDVEGYDSYIDDISQLSVKKFLNSDAILVPNLTYNPRAAKLPKNSIADGSAAILYTELTISDEQIAYFSSEEFRKFYKIARNFGTRSMNIDSTSVKYFGLKYNSK